MSRFLLQMAGMPGSGKSTLALALATTTGAVLLDKDIVQSAALRAGADEQRAGGLAYEVLFDLATDLARYDHSLIVDSAAFFPLILSKGRRIAEDFEMQYRVIECVCPRCELQARLARRESRPSQWTALLDIDMESRPGAERLSCPRLIVDTTKPLDSYLPEALRYIGYDAG